MSIRFLDALIKKRDDFFVGASRTGYIRPWDPTIKLVDDQTGMFPEHIAWCQEVPGASLSHEITFHTPETTESPEIYLFALKAACSHVIWSLPSESLTELCEVLLHMKKFYEEQLHSDPKSIQPEKIPYRARVRKTYTRAPLTLAEE